MQDKKHTILIICPYSYPSACGIWARVYSDAKALIAAGFEVHVFSSNIVKGTNQTSSEYKLFEGIHLHRFKVWFSLGGTSMFWFFYRKFKKIKPDIVHVHGFRHPHSLQGFIFAKLSMKPVFMTSHGPFEKDKNRSYLLKIIDSLYDKLIGYLELRNYKSIIMISKWEQKYLEKLGARKLILIPNGINSQFISTPFSSLENPTEEQGTANQPVNKVLYMGRVDPVKRLEWIEYAAEKLPHVRFKIRGPIQGYSNLKSTVPNLEIQNEKYTISEFIQELDNSDIFVLPSVRESFGLVLVEAMSRGKIVISSDTKGANDIIQNGENGFIIESEDELIEAIEYTYNHWDILQPVQAAAIETSKQYDERITTKKLIQLYSDAVR